MSSLVRSLPGRNSKHLSNRMSDKLSKYARQNVTKMPFGFMYFFLCLPSSSSTSFSHDSCRVEIILSKAVLFNCFSAKPRPKLTITRPSAPPIHPSHIPSETSLPVALALRPGDNSLSYYDCLDDQRWGYYYVLFCCRKDQTQTPKTFERAGHGTFHENRISTFGYRSSDQGLHHQKP